MRAPARLSACRGRMLSFPRPISLAGEAPSSKDRALRSQIDCDAILGARVYARWTFPLTPSV